MKPKYWLILGIVAVASATSAACSSEFKSCAESRTCPPKAGSGGMGEAGESAEAEAGAWQAAGNGGEAGAAEPISSEAGAGGEAGAVEPQCDATIDLDSDPKNCGRCGHDCLGGSCTSRSCDPITLATDQGSLFTVAVDDTFVYWGGDNAAIAKTRLDGTGMGKTFVAKGSDEFSYFWVFAGDTLLWGNDWHDKGVRGCSVPDCSGGPKTLIEGSSDLRAIAYDQKNKSLFWSEDDTGIWRQPAAGSPGLFAPITTAWVARMVTDGTFLYWTEYDKTNKLTSIKKSPTGSLNVTTLAFGLSAIEDVAVQGNELYVIEHSDTIREVRTISLPNGIGSGLPSPIGSGASGIRLAVDTSGVYWASANSIETCPLAGCGVGPKTLAPAEKARDITTDAKAVYWVTEAGQVVKVAK